MSFTKFALALAAASAIATTATAGPITVDASNIGQSYNVGFDGYTQEAGVIGGLTGQATFTLTGVGSNSYSFNYSITNTSSAPIDGSRISLFGFNTDPNIVNATSTGMFNQTSTGNVPAGYGRVDVCFKGAGGNNCSGGGGVGVNIGDTASGTLTLNFAELPDQLTLSDFFVRYQSISGGGAPGSAIGRETGSTSTSSSTGGTPVPAPGALWLFAAGLAGLGWRFGRRRG
jgi:hypothetical protein